MKLPYPFESAVGVQITPEGWINLVDAGDKPLARVPLVTGFELSEPDQGHGYGYGSGLGCGYSYGYGRGSAYGDGRGYGDCIGSGNGSGPK